MGTRQVPLVRKDRSKRSAERGQRFYDTFAIVLIALGALSLISLLLRETGFLGRALQDVLRLLFGVGAYLIPLVCWTMASIMLLGAKRFSMPSVIAGALLVFLSVISWSAHPFPGTNNWFEPNTLKAGGGYLGSAIGFMLNQALGSGTPIVIAAMFIIGLILIVDVPLVDLIRYAWHAWTIGSNASRKGAVAVGKAGAAIADKVKTIPRDRAIVGFPIDNDDDEPPKDRKADIIHRAFSKQKAEEDQADTNQASHPQGTLPNGDYNLPPITLLKEPLPPPKRIQAEINSKIEVLERTLDEFGIGANVSEIAHGPTVTRYEIQLAPGIKVSKIVSLADNLAMALAAIDVRVEAPIPGKSAIGVEVPNDNPAIVTLRECIDSPSFWNAPSRLTIVLGKDVSNTTRYADLTKMPHLLIGGATNSGKSVGLSTIISSLIYRNTPKDLRMVLIDPKRVELSLFEGIPHLMCPVVKSAKVVPGILRSVVKEMDKRYDTLARAGARNIDSFNEKVSDNEKLPYIVVVIDELADLMMQSAAEVETTICRIAQLARATGIHLIIATQRPSVDVITGTIKANISSRIAFAVASQVDSRTILDMSGADRLIGRGDMLFMPIDAAKPLRIQGCYVSDTEINALVEFWKEQETPVYTLTATETNNEREDVVDEEEDEIYPQAIRLVVSNGQASTSMLQRRFRIGYGRAARLLDIMERRGIVGPLDGPRPREILISRMEAEEILSGRGSYGDTN